MLIQKDIDFELRDLEGKVLSISNLEVSQAVQTSINIVELANSKSKSNQSVENLVDPNSLRVLALDSTFRWDKKVITFSFSKGDYADGFSNWKLLNDIQKNIIREVFSKISQYVDLSFVEVSSGGDIQFGSADLEKALGITYSVVNLRTRTFEPPVIVLFDNQIQNKVDTFFSKTERGYSGIGFYVIMHEIGHALGLKHPFEGAYLLPERADHISLTVMSYDFSGTFVPYFNYTGKEVNAVGLAHWTPTNLGILDYETLQIKYGANLKHNLGDTVYDYRYLIESNQPYFATIWDAGGVDTLDLSHVEDSCLINLTDGTVSTVSFSPQRWKELWIRNLQNQGLTQTSVKDFVESFVNRLSYRGLLYDGDNSLSIITGSIIENVKTGKADDLVIDNKFDNIILTGGGNDRIFITGGFDRVYGGEGIDRVYLETSKSQVVYGRVDDGLLIVGESFAVKLVGVEEVVFFDGFWNLV